MSQNLINYKSKNLFDNELKNIIASAYRRFLLRICNERISIFNFANKLNFSAKKLKLDSENLKEIFKKFDYIDYQLTFDEREYLRSIRYNFDDFYSNVYNSSNLKIMDQTDINICYNRFLLRCCNKRISLYYFAKMFDELSPDSLKLYNKEALLNFFDRFKYRDCALTEPERQYLISISIDIKKWNFPIVIPDQPMSISSDECDSKDEEYEYDEIYKYKQENIENDIMKKIISMKNDIENYLNKHMDNEIKNKIIKNIFYTVFQMNKSKCDCIKQQSEFIKKKEELKTKLHDIEESIKNVTKTIEEYETKESKEIAIVENIKINIFEISFDKSKSKSVNKFSDNILLFNLYYKDNIKPEWMKNDTTCIINNKERFNKEILDYVEYITLDENLANKRKKTEEILNECIHQKYKEWQVLKFGSDTQGISHIFSDLDFEIIAKEITNLKYNNEIYCLKQISNIIKEKFTQI